MLIKLINYKNRLESQSITVDELKLDILHLLLDDTDKSILFLYDDKILTDLSIKQIKDVEVTHEIFYIKSIDETDFDQFDKCVIDFKISNNKISDVKLYGESLIKETSDISVDDEISKIIVNDAVTYINTLKGVYYTVKEGVKNKHFVDDALRGIIFINDSVGYTHRSLYIFKEGKINDVFRYKQKINKVEKDGNLIGVATGKRIYRIKTE